MYDCGLTPFLPEIPTKVFLKCLRWFHFYAISCDSLFEGLSCLPNSCSLRWFISLDNFSQVNMMLGPTTRCYESQGTTVRPLGQMVSLASFLSLLIRNRTIQEYHSLERICVSERNNRRESIGSHAVNRDQTGNIKDFNLTPVKSSKTAAGPD